MFSVLIPRNQEKYEVYQAQPPCLVSLSTSGRSSCISERAVVCRLTHCHSSHRHSSHTVGLGIVFQGLLLQIRCVLPNKVTSHRVWLFTTHRRTLVERGYVYSHLPPLENSQGPASGQKYLPSVAPHPGHGSADST